MVDDLTLSPDPGPGTIRNMIKLVFCVHRLPGMDEAEFHRYWRDVHGPLVAQFAESLGIRRYVQTHSAARPLSDALGALRGAPDAFDGVAELWFESAEALMTSAGSPEGVAAGQALLAD